MNQTFIFQYNKGNENGLLENISLEVSTSYSVAVPPDTTAPVLTITAPSGQLPAGTKEATLLVTTDEAATCKYSNTKGTPYDSMTALDTTGGTSHSTTLSGLSDGASYRESRWRERFR